MTQREGLMLLLEVPVLGSDEDSSSGVSSIFGSCCETEHGVVVRRKVNVCGSPIMSGPFIMLG